MVSAEHARAFADALLAVLLAPSCAACAQPLDSPTRGPVCAACWARIVPLTTPLCRTCADVLPSWRVLGMQRQQCPRCRRGGTPIALARAAGAYEGALRDIVHALKYDGRRSLARPLAALMRTHGRDVLDGADLVVAVPLHASRRRQRGFNQAGELARHLGVRSAGVLRRTRATPAQADLPAARRRANVRGAFRLRRGANVNGMCVVIVDDVSTTGATLDACARALLDGGAREVRALTAARAVSRPR